MSVTASSCQPSCGSIRLLQLHYVLFFQLRTMSKLHNGAARKAATTCLGELPTQNHPYLKHSQNSLDTCDDLDPQCMVFLTFADCMNTGGRRDQILRCYAQLHPMLPCRLKETAENKQIKMAYYKLSRLWHPVGMKVPVCAAPTSFQLTQPDWQSH